MRVLLGFGVLLAGCAGVADGPAATDSKSLKEYDYMCENGVNLKVVFEKNHAVVTQNGGQVLMLPQMPSGSGIRYATLRHELRGKGNDATWTVGKRAAMKCRTES